MQAAIVGGAVARLADDLLRLLPDSVAGQHTRADRAAIGFRADQLHLTAWYAGVLALTLAVAGIGIWLGIRQSFTETVDKDLRSRVRTIRIFLDRPPTAHEGSTAIEELAGGDTEAESQLGSGSRFRVLLPVLCTGPELLVAEFRIQFVDTPSFTWVKIFSSAERFVPSDRL